MTDGKRPKLFGFERRYEEFSRCFEVEVGYTIKTDLDEKSDLKVQRELQREKRAADAAAFREAERRTAKMAAMFDVYYDFRRAKLCKKYYEE